MTQNDAEDPNKLDARSLDEIQTLEAVAERDIDLLLIEELQVDSSFRCWFYGLAGELATTTQHFSGPGIP